MYDRDFLTWLHTRLEQVHGEDPQVDYMYKLRAIIKATDPDNVTSSSGIPGSLAALENSLTQPSDEIDDSPETHCHNAWQRAEAYQVPMTDEGTKKAEERYRQFKVGYYAGLNSAASVLEREHKKVKDNGNQHNFYLVASNIVRKIS